MNDKLINDEIKIIEAASRGDIKAYEELINRYQKKIYATAYYILLDSDEADDIVQAVFITLWKSLSKLKSSGKFRTWLYRITVNKAIDAIRGRKKMSSADLELIQIDQEEKVVMKHDIRKIISRVIAILPEQQRVVLVLKDIEGFEMSEIAKIMKISESTVRSHLSLARQNFQKELNAKFPEYRIQKGE